VDSVASGLRPKRFESACELSTINYPLPFQGDGEVMIRSLPRCGRLLCNVLSGRRGKEKNKNSADMLQKIQVRKKIRKLEKIIEIIKII
jgi:hypothetical protein